MDGAKLYVILFQRHIEEWLRLLHHVLVSAVQYDSDNFDHRWPGWPPETETLADRVFLGPEGLRHRLVDNRYGWRFLFVGIGEQPSGLQGNPQSLEITWSHGIVHDRRSLLPRRHRMPFQDDWVVRANNAHWDGECLSYGHNARQGADPLVDLAIQFPSACFAKARLLHV